MFFKRAAKRKTTDKQPKTTRLRYESLENRQMMTTFYIAPTGNDNNAGTAAAPMATLSHVEGSMQPGDTVDLQAGTYQWSAALWWNKSGTAAAPITITGAPGATAIIDGSQMPANSNVFGMDASYVTVQNLTIENAPNTGLLLYQGTNCIVNHVTVHNGQETGIQVGDNADSTMQLAEDDIVENSTVYSNDQINSPTERNANTVWGGGISVFGASHIVVKGNSVYDNYGEGIDLVCANWCYAQSNFVEDNYSVEMYLDNATNSTLQNNLVYCSGRTSFFRDGAGAKGIVLANESYSFQNLNDYDTIEDNIVAGGAIGFATFDSYGLGYAFRNTLVINNTFFAASQEIVSIQNSMGTNVGDRLANNVFEQTGSTAALASYQSGGVTFDHNLWWGGNSNNDGMTGAGDVKKNPLLASPGSSSAAGYKLGSGSPAIATGSATNAPADNDEWSARGNSVNIGAF